MKKFIFLAVTALAILSFGGNMFSAHAQTVSPTDAAALQQSLDMMKAKLINLEMQAGMVPGGDADLTAGTPAVAGATVTVTPAPANQLSAADLAAISTALTALRTALGNLSAQITANPQLTPASEQAILTALQGIGNTLALMKTTLAGGAPASVPTGVASQPSAGSQGSGAVVSANPTPTTNPGTTGVNPNPTPAPSGNGSQTAQASSMWSFVKAHWPTILIILLVIVILAILLWPEGEEKAQTPRPAKPAAPSVAASVSTSSQPSIPVTVVTPAVDFQQTKVTVVRPPEIPKKKPA